MNTTTLSNPSAAFWDKTAAKYAGKPVADPAAYDAKIDRIRALLRAEDRMLEIGCGTGSTALRLAPDVAEITATDISSRMIEIAEDKRVSAEASNLSFVLADANARLPGAPFDVIAAFSLLHLVADMPSVLASVHDQLKPGGVFLSKTVCLGDASAPLRFVVRALGMIGVAPPVTILSRAELSRALVRAGFDLVECRYFGKGRLNPFIIAQRPS
ncbi:methyltransferase domain-containing protein [uncultured Tateyamaria sp.]|uniref:class I SAM-dependent methyltransferase n=1 Tax=uncultured Tateyamaria sp. TaxID=455651 RepID=UPI00260BCFA5|nr:methyltransferase domain-containing protein [uncultured Tateyamaria sp.]